MFLLAASLLGFNRLKPTVLSAFSSTPTFAEISGHCSHIPPIPAEEFLERQQRLVDTLISLNASAYITEPGPSGHYYANLSSWKLSERPLLLIISPDASLRPNVTILTPYFEESRAKLMTIPSRNHVSYATWREEVSPYEVAIDAIPSLTAEGLVFVEGEMRAFVLDGLSKAVPSASVLLAPVEIQRLRQRKSSRELEIMKCANEVRRTRGFCDQPDSDFLAKRRLFWLSELFNKGYISVSLNLRLAPSSSRPSRLRAYQVAMGSYFSEVSSKSMII